MFLPLTMMDGGGKHQKENIKGSQEQKERG